MRALGSTAGPLDVPGPSFSNFHLHARFHFQEPESSHGLAALPIV